MLKADLHLHAKGSPLDYCPYTPEEMIDYYAKLGFEVMAFTYHDMVFFPKKIVEYAAKRNILLVPGCEVSIEKVHVLVYNKDADKLKRIVKNLQSMNKLDKIKSLKDDCIVIAPHPFYRYPLNPFKKYLGKSLPRIIKAFDGIEFAHFYYPGFTRNKKAVALAKKHKLPLIGSGDVHRLYQANYTYSMIDAKKDAGSVLDAIRKNKIHLLTQPLPFRIFLLHGLKMLFWRT